MILSTTKTITIAAGMLACFAASTQLTAASPATSSTVTYTATGTFAGTATSGSDIFKLAGQTFTINISAPEGLKPTKSGTGFAVYTKLKMTGTVQSGLVPTPITLSTNAASIELGAGKNDVFALFAPVKVLGLQINITAKITLPSGTIGTTAIGPLKAQAAYTATTSSATYSDTSAKTTLGVNGALSTAVK